MTSYLGHLGQLVPLRSPASISIPAQLSVSVETTLGGRRVAQIPAGGAHREWQIGMSASDPEDIGTLQGFVHGEFGRGPWWWLENWAQSVNVLPPRVASLEQPWRNTVHGGPITLPGGGVAGRSLIASGTTYIDVPTGTALRLPCVPGVPVTASAWLSSQGQDMAIIARDSSAATLATSPVGATTGPGLQRAAATLTPPEGTNHVIVRFRGSGRIVRPALTWSSEALLWGAGAGCQQAIVTESSLQPLLAAQLIATASYSVIEVGP